MPIDLRSDTVTKPTAAMRKAMYEAEVGDDVFQDDPTINRLEAMVAELMGKEAALYVPSGTMGNQLCLRAHSQPGDSVIAHEHAHILLYESGAPCALSGLQPRVISTEDGKFTVEQVLARVTPVNIHHSQNRILAIENTHNRCGGAVWGMQQFTDVCRAGHDSGLVVHMDGARIWNACAATGTEPTDWTQHVDSVSVCFSKGLGAPIGSALSGSRKFVERCRFFRKMFGGQMRQGGILASAVIYALENHRKRVVDDHANCMLLFDLISQARGITCVKPQSNILMVDIEDGVTAEDLATMLNEDFNVWVLAIGPQRIRAVTHLDVSGEQCKEAGHAFQVSADRLWDQKGNAEA